MSSPIRLLTYTTLYPNREAPTHGVFVENRLRRLVATGEVQSRVLAPVPWFFSRASCFGRYGRFARVPRREERHSIGIQHPRYLVIPKLGMRLTPALLTRATLPSVRRQLAADSPPQILDAHYFFPDGVAAAAISERTGVPLVISARGSDVNLIPRVAWARERILWAASRAQAVIAVSAALKDSMVDLGIQADRIHVLRNGVDLEVFQPPSDRDALRQRLGFGRTTLLCVGNLVPLKGHALVVRALKGLPDCDLVIIGDGVERRAIEREVANCGVDTRVRFVGRVPHEDLPDFYGAADALLLASSSEGWANVLLESMACGTAVVATRVGGNPEAVSAPAAGVLAGERTVVSIREAVQRLFAANPARDATRRYAEGFSWDDTIRRQIDLYCAALNGRGTVDSRRSDR